MKPLRWPRMWGPPRLDAADFNDQLDRDGLQTLIRRGTICGCVDAETRTPDENCTVCDTWGFVYEGGQTLPVLWVGNDPHVKLYERAGVHEPAGYKVTWPSTLPLGYGAIFVHPMETNVVPNELLVRGAVDADNVSLERLRYMHITRVEEVRTRDVVYDEGVDWALVGQRITWLEDGAAPATGAHYGVRYGHRSIWIIDEDTPMLREDGATNRLAYTCKVRKFAAITRRSGSWLGQG